jgi:hypothetical protein
MTTSKPPNQNDDEATKGHDGEKDRGTDGYILRWSATGSDHVLGLVININYTPQVADGGSSNTPWPTCPGARLGA